MLSGTILLEANSSKTDIMINYPEGYNNTNCVVLSVMLELENSSTLWGYGATYDSLSNVGANISKRITLRDSDIYFGIRPIYMSSTDGVINSIIEPRSSDNRTYNYKIVLMKIA